MKKLILVYDICFFQGEDRWALIVFGDECGDGIAAVIWDEFDFIRTIGALYNHAVGQGYGLCWWRR